MSLRTLVISTIILTGLTLVGCSGEPEASVGRLAVIGSDGNVAMINADGSDRSAITSDAEFGVIYSQLTWSQQGSLAYVRASVGGGDGISAQASATDLNAQSISATIEVIDPNGERSSHFVPFPPFYMYWSPDGQRLAYLGTSPPRLQLSVLDPGTGESMPVFNSQPLYFDWSPASDRLITHHEGTSMQLLLEGEPQSFENDTGVFFSPTWSEEGIFLIGLEAGRSRLETRDPSGAMIESIDLDSQNTSFSIGGSGNIAILERTNELAGTLSVVGNVDAELSSQALWFFWNHQRDALVWMEQAGETINLQTWDLASGESVAIGEGQLSRYWLQTYLQFFDQYSLSHSWWSPDGSSFLFFGTIGDRSGVWLFDTGGQGDPTFLIEGSEAAFDPR